MAYTINGEENNVEIVEPPIFTRKIKDVLSDDEYSKLQWALVINPEAGVLIPGGKGTVGYYRERQAWRVTDYILLVCAR